MQKRPERPKKLPRLPSSPDLQKNASPEKKHLPLSAQRLKQRRLHSLLQLPRLKQKQSSLKLKRQERKLKLPERSRLRELRLRLRHLHSSETLWQLPRIQLLREFPLLHL